MRWIFVAATVAMLSPLATASLAQDRDQTLADIRQELSLLYVDIQRLKRELSTSGGASGISGGSTLDRVNAIEAQMTRLTSKTEQLEHRINRIVSDGSNRLGDLEFRLCELESGCDIAQLGQGSTLGGTPDGGAGSPAAQPTPTPGAEPELAMGERADFDRATAALDRGDAQAAAAGFAEFVTSYPGSPLAGMAHIKRGEALETSGDKTGAARAYLEAFSAAPEGADAPEALFRLGRALGGLGQKTEACVTLSEVGVRFPQAAAVGSAQAERARLGCQ